jgi:hypothetical protein
MTEIAYRRRLASLLVVLCCLVPAWGLVVDRTPASAGTYVHGYTRKDGTYVAPYYRKSPGTSSVIPHSGSSGEKRSPEARRDFMKSHPCPSTGKTSGACPGYVVDHVTPLKRGGADAPFNMQWQTIEQGKAKDKWE